MKKKIVSIMSIIMAVPAVALAQTAEWVPLVQVSDFDGLKADIMTAVGVVFGICLIVAGAGILIRMIQR